MLYLQGCIGVSCKKRTMDIFSLLFMSVLL